MVRINITGLVGSTIGVSAFLIIGALDILLFESQEVWVMMMVGLGSVSLVMAALEISGNGILTSVYTFNVSITIFCLCVWQIISYFLFPNAAPVPLRDVVFYALVIGVVGVGLWWYDRQIRSAMKNRSQLESSIESEN